MRSTIPSLPICSVLSRLFFTWFKSFPLTVTSVYLDMEMVATKGNPVEARTLWSHTDNCCSTCLPTGNGTKAESHSPKCPTFGVLPFTTQNYISPSLLHTTTKKKEKKIYSVQVSGSAPCIQSTHTGHWEHPLHASAKATCACCTTCAQSHERVQASTAPFPQFLSRETHQEL